MTIHLSLPRAQRRRMQRRLCKTGSRIEALRCRILLLLHEGDAAALVAEVAGCVRATVCRTVYRFEDLGEDGLRDQRTWREPTKARAQVEARVPGYLAHVPKDFGWHRSTWTLKLLSLQPYSPNDNPIERLWKQLHDHVTRNYRHPVIESLVADVERFLQEVQPFPGTKVSTLRVAA